MSSSKEKTPKMAKCLLAAGTPSEHKLYPVVEGQRPAPAEHTMRLDYRHAEMRQLVVKAVAALDDCQQNAGRSLARERLVYVGAPLDDADVDRATMAQFIAEVFRLAAEYIVLDGDTDGPVAEWLGEESGEHRVEELTEALTVWSQKSAGALVYADVWATYGTQIANMRAPFGLKPPRKPDYLPAYVAPTYRELGPGSRRHVSTVDILGACMVFSMSDPSFECSAGIAGGRSSLPLPGFDLSDFFDTAFFESGVKSMFTERFCEAEDSLLSEDDFIEIRHIAIVVIGRALIAYNAVCAGLN